MNFETSNSSPFQSSSVLPIHAFVCICCYFDLPQCFKVVIFMFYSIWCGPTARHKMDKNLNRNNQVDSLIHKLNARINLLKRANALIKPLLEYCYSVWGNTSNENLCTLIRIPKRCARIILDANILGSRDGVVVRALAFHQCGPGSIPGPGVICGLSLLLVLYSAPRGFSPGTPLFPSSHQSPTFPLI